jgi:hypothetical protein
VARCLAEDLGWNYLSTDQLARHPGRPWKTGDREVPEDVAEHYADLSTPVLLDAVLGHYRSNVWPIVDAIVSSRLNNPFDLGLVFEGSAILPEQVRAAGYTRVSTVWLTAEDDLIATRVRQSSGYIDLDQPERRLIDAFLGRTLALDHFLTESALRNEQILIDVGVTDAFEKLRADLPR